MQRKKEEDEKMDKEIEEMREEPWQRKGKYKEKKNIGKSVDEGRLVEIDGETDAFWDLWKDKTTVSPVAMTPRQTARRGVPFRRR